MTARGTWLVAFTAIVIVGLSVTAPAPTLTTTAAVRHRDALTLRHIDATFGDDGASYRAMAEHGVASTYLTKRTPFAYRVAKPSAARVLRQTGISTIWAFRILDLAALAGLGAALYLLGRSFGATEYQAAAAQACALLTYKCGPLVARSPGDVVDAGMWAFGLAAWYVARRAPSRWQAVVVGCLVACAVLFAESGLLFLPLIAFEMRHQRLGRILFVAAAGAAAAVVPRVLIDVVFDPGIRHGMLPAVRENARFLERPAAGLRLLSELVVAGVGVSVVALVSPESRRAARGSLFVVPLFLALALATHEVGRHTTPVALVLAPAFALALPKSNRVGAAAVVATAAVALLRVYASFYVLAASTVIVAVAAACILERQRTRVSPGPS